MLARVEAGAFANAVLDAQLSSSRLAVRDKALVTELVYGVLRHKRACDYLVDRFVRSKPAPRTRIALRIGSYQLAFMHQAPHAAVSTAVSVAPAHDRRFVNALLRRLAVELSSGAASCWPDEGTRLGYPDWMVDLLVADLGRQAALGALEAMNVASPTPARPDGYLQDLASQWVAAAVGAGEGDVVVDCCAAPGGKAGAICSKVGSRPALVVAADANPARVRRMARASQGSEAPIAHLISDARSPALRPGCADKVVVDAPCSGLGALRRRPDARWRLRNEDVAGLAALQREILPGAMALLRPGGELTFSVCTLSRAETVEIDEWLAAEHPRWRALEPPGEPWARLGRGALLLPQAAGTDGMYILRLEAPG